MGDDVELHWSGIAAGRLDEEGRPAQDFAELPRRLVEAAAPVVTELERGEGTGAFEIRLVSSCRRGRTDPNGLQGMPIGPYHKR